jgi:tetratricopeptide (TPR) repeat protein
VQDQRGTVGRPLSQIREVRMAVTPPQFAQAQQAMAAQKYDEALKDLQAIATFRGLPSPWAQQATAMLGDIYIAKGEIDKAEAAYKDFQRLYPEAAQAGGASEIGLARLAVAKKDFETAKQKVQPIADQALKEKSPPLSQTTAFTYSQAFLVLGEVKEGEGDFKGALENYLRTVTLFPQDRAAAALAEQKADALRKAHPDLFIP